jgi:CheY-like chemotaxis protein
MRILIVDDHPIVASGCRTVLADEPDVVLLEAADAESAEQAFTAQHPDICVIDINLPTVSGFELARRLLVRDGAARIIMFSMNDDPVFVARAIETGAKGYVSKTGDPQDLIDAIRESQETAFICRRRWPKASPLPAPASRKARLPGSARASWKSCGCSARVRACPRFSGEHVIDHPTEARRSHLGRAGAAGHRVRRILTGSPGPRPSDHDSAKRFAEQIV